MSVLKENKPTADILMNSMRSMGYSFESAVADIIDNSISAGAHKVHLKFPVDPSESYVAICDDGCGMTSAELFDAMKYGSERKRDGRDEGDLGRFGLGLKAASLSQCRKLTVASKKESEISAYIWDLDIIQEKRDWFIVECSPEQIKSIRFSEWLENVESGTIVLWENFDLIEKASGNVYAELSRYQQSTSEYLSLIFHRFLNKTGTSHLEIKINNYMLKGLDPFLENHPKTDVRKKFEIPIEDSNGIERMVSIQPYVLPFQKYLSAEDKKQSGGIENYRSKQGFYIYRNERLIVWGTWFRRHRDELTKNARIKVDIPNSLDDIWGIDIKKQNATIPPVIRNRLTRAVDEVMDRSAKAQSFRGRVEKVNEKIDYIWDRIEGRGAQFTYRINRESRIFDLIKDKVDDEVWSYIDMILEEIEKAVPYQQIYIDKSQDRIDDPAGRDAGKDADRLADIESKALIFISLAEKMGNTDKAAVIEKLFTSEPFINYLELKEKLLEMV